MYIKLCGITCIALYLCLSKHMRCIHTFVGSVVRFCHARLCDIYAMHVLTQYCNNRSHAVQLILDVSNVHQWCVDLYSVIQTQASSCQFIVHNKSVSQMDITSFLLKKELPIFFYCKRFAAKYVD